LSWPLLATQLHAKSLNPDGRSGGLLRAETGASLATRLLAAIVASVGPRLLANTPPALFQVLWRRLRVRTFGSEEAQAVPKSNIQGGWVRRKSSAQCSRLSASCRDGCF
jgi:hypothetical protein